MTASPSCSRTSATPAAPRAEPRSEPEPQRTGADPAARLLERRAVPVGQPLHEYAGDVPERLVAAGDDREVERGRDLLARLEPAAQVPGEVERLELHRAAVVLSAAEVAQH